MKKIFILLAGLIIWFLAGYPKIWQNPPIPPTIKQVLASNWLANPSFTGGDTDWILSGTTYDSSYYQDTAGSAKTVTDIGRNKNLSGNAQQTVNIEAGSSIALTLYWSKQSVSATSLTNDIRVEIAKPSDQDTWVQIWADTSNPAAGSPTSWTGPSALDVSSYFDETGSYLIRLYANLKNPNDKYAQTFAWFDNANLDVTPPNITVGTGGTQTPSASAGDSDKHIGGYFTLTRNVGSTNVSQIIITEAGDINANTSLSNLDLYYETADTCQYNADETLFGTAASFDGSEQATITGSMDVGTSQVCLYPVLDVGSSASVGQTIDIEITNPSTQVTADSGTVSPGTTVVMLILVTWILVLVW